MASNETKNQDLFEEEDNVASSLDHAILESIFYNEMMMLDDSLSVISSSLLSTLAADGSVRVPLMDISTAAAEDVLAIPPPIQPPDPVQLQCEPPLLVQNQRYHRPSLNPTQMQPTVPTYEVHSSPQTQHGSPAIHSAPSMSFASQSTKKFSYTKIPESSQTLDSDAAFVADEEKRQKLVSQFAALATRLGVTLPDPVVQSLTHPHQTYPPLSMTTKIGALSSPIGPTILQPDTNTASPTFPPQSSVSDDLFFEIPDSSTATAVSARKRTAVSMDTGNESEGNGHTMDSTVSTTASSKIKQPPYSKRRKKPRLQDCESKLAELEAENAMLKRHLANLSAQSLALDQERDTQQQKMVLMLEQGADETELDGAVKHFTEMYSDYGRRRHSELNFHLDQLQRLANPTNFTKLGLWTMGQQSKNSRNPIAGILQKELGISAQQGKKILEQRKRIQDVCSNLRQCLALLADLRTLCAQKTQIFHDRLSKCREILTPRQVVQLIIWINQNTEMLEQVCPGWGSEHIHSKKPPPAHSKAKSE